MLPPCEMGNLLPEQSHPVVGGITLSPDYYRLVREVPTGIGGENSGLDKRYDIHKFLEALEVDVPGCKVRAVVLDLVGTKAAGDLVDGDADFPNREAIFGGQDAFSGTATGVLWLAGLAQFDFVRVFFDAKDEIVAKGVFWVEIC